MSIYDVNNAQLGDGTDGAGIFATYTRINHSCAPNTDWDWQPDSQALEVCANQDIAAGEEITITYIDTLQPYETRARELAVYGFECRCKACYDPVKAISDLGRQALEDLTRAREHLERLSSGEEPIENVDPFMLDNCGMIISELATKHVEFLTAEGLTGSELDRALVSFHVVVSLLSFEFRADQSSN